MKRFFYSCCGAAVALVAYGAADYAVMRRRFARRAT